MDTEQPAPRTRLRSMLLVTGVSLGAAGVRQAQGVGPPGRPASADRHEAG